MSFDSAALTRMLGDLLRYQVPRSASLGTHTFSIPHVSVCFLNSGIVCGFPDARRHLS
jgi:hypothetical protein